MVDWSCIYPDINSAAINNLEAIEQFLVGEAFGTDTKAGVDFSENL